MLLPRIHRFLPTKTILEIAPGHGRWTQFLHNYGENIFLVDLSSSCIDACKKRFSETKNISYHVNDGKSLSMTPDNKIDFIFSFDSLVHADDDVIESYISEISKKLSKDGAAFIHHSNLGEYSFQVRYSKIPKLRVILRILGILEKKLHWRSPLMTAQKMVSFCTNHGLKCISQELVNWNTRSTLIDCFSTIVREDSKWTRDIKVLRNKSFMKDAEKIKLLSLIYCDNIK